MRAVPHQEAFTQFIARVVSPSPMAARVISVSGLAGLMGLPADPGRSDPRGVATTATQRTVDVIGSDAEPRDERPGGL